MAGEAASGDAPWVGAAFVTEARRLRNYLLRTGAVNQSELVDALMPFELDPDLDATADQRTRLFHAFEAVKRRLDGVVDPYTLNEVLNGNSPFLSDQPRHVRFYSSWRGFVVTALGIGLVLLALHYSNWSNRAAYLLQAADEFARFDHVEQMTNLIELALLIEETEAAVSTSGGDDGSDAGGSGQTFRVDMNSHGVVISEMIENLRQHYARENSLLDDIGFHNGDLLTLERALNTTVRNWACPPPFLPADHARFQRAEAGGQELTVAERMIGCAKPLQEPSPPGTAPDASLLAVVLDAFQGLVDPSKLGPTGAGDPGAGGPGADGLETTLNVIAPKAFAAFDLVKQTEDRAMELAERSQYLQLDYVQSLERIRGHAARVESNLLTVNRWALPIVYGMLGSIVYCMWRILNPATAALGLLYTLMRTAFAGLAALTLSMLIVPSNALSTGAEISRPLVYLISFIFGYSIEGFVNLLNNLNRYLSTTMTPREDRDGGKAPG